MLPVVYHPDYQIPLRSGHRFPMSKYGYLQAALTRRGLLEVGSRSIPAPASEAVVQRVHAADYVSRVFRSELRADETRRIGLPNAPRVARRARLATAGTLLATRLAVEYGLALNAAGGSHHAGPEGGAGYCVFNDVGVAIAALMASGGPSPVLVVDCDVHQGDGTARICEDLPGVYTLSLHGARNYPARKARSSLDIGLPDQTGDAAYLAALEAALDQALTDAQPQIVFYNAGVDVWHGDRLGRLAVTSEGIRARDRLVIRRVRDLGLPLVGVLGGGYDDDRERLAGHHAVLFEEAAAALAA